MEGNKRLSRLIFGNLPAMFAIQRILSIPKIFITIQILGIGLVRFLRTVQTFSWFLKSNWRSDFDRAETRNGANKQVEKRKKVIKIFYFTLKYSEKTVYEKNCTLLWFFFVHMRKYYLEFIVY